MALTFHSGFETGTFLEWYSTTGSPAISVAQKNTGAYSMLCDTTGGAATAFASSGAQQNDRFAGYIYIDTAPSVDCSIAPYLTLTTDRKIKLTPDGTTGATVLAVDTWYRISLASDDTDTKVYINGNLEISAVQDSAYVGAAVIGVRTSCTAKIYFDDFATDSTAATTDDIGDILCAIVANPNAAGDTNAFDTAVPDVAHYLNYDDPAGSLDDATYVEETAKTSVADIANLDSCTDIGMAGTDVIDAVNCFARMFGDDADPTAGMQVKDNGTAYNTIVQFFDDATLEWVDAYYTTMPNDAAAWTQARFNAFQVGGYHATDADNTRLSCVYVMVAYHSVSAPAERRIFITHV